MAVTPTSKADSALETLRQQLPDGLEVDFDRLFPEATGFGVAKANNRRMRLLNNCAPVLRAALQPNEKILYLSQGAVNSFWEQYFTGWAAIYRNQTLVVATDRRYIMVHCDRKGRPCHFVNDLPYEAITKQKPGGSMVSFFLQWNGGKLALAYIGKKDGKRLLEYRKEAQGRSPQSEVVRNSTKLGHLCPSCYTPSDQIIEKCPKCMTRFKSPKTAALRSLLLPGLGDYYLGHKFFAVMEMIGSLFLIAIVVSILANSRSTSDILAGIVIGVVMLGFYHGVDAIVTYYIGKKGLIAENEELTQKAI